eukprot:m51a1_g9442 hypothetical protein (993) ;mRNA; f:447995-451958
MAEFGERPLRSPPAREPPRADKLVPLRDFLGRLSDCKRPAAAPTKEYRDDAAPAELRAAYYHALLCVVGASVGPLVSRAHPDALSALGALFHAWLRGAPVRDASADLPARDWSLACRLLYAHASPYEPRELADALRTFASSHARTSSGAAFPCSARSVAAAFAPHAHAAAAGSDKQAAASAERRVLWLVFLYARDVRMSRRVEKLMNAVGVDAESHCRAMAAALAMAVPQREAAELRQRAANVSSHPFYSRESFASQAQFEQWARRESELVSSFSSPSSSQPLPAPAGVVHLRVMGVRGMAKEVSGAYFKVAVGSDKRKTMPLPVKCKNPPFYEEFSLVVPDLSCDVVVSIRETGSVKDSCLAKVKIPTPKWHPLKNGIEVCLEATGLAFPTQYTPLLPHHVYYKILSHKLTMLDLVSLSETEKPDDEVSFSPDTRWMLETYAQRFGVGFAAHIINLSSVARVLEHTVTKPLLSHALSLLETSLRPPATLNLTETAYLQEVFNSLHRTCRSWISRYFLVFPRNEPAGALELLLELFAKADSTTQDAPPLQQSLRKYLDEAARLMIEMQTMTYAGRMSADTLASIADAMDDLFEEDREHFSSAFAKYGVDMHEVVARTVTAWLSDKVPAIVERPTSPGEGKSDAAVVCYSALRGLMSNYVSSTPSFGVADALPLCKLFRDAVFKFMWSASAKFVDWSANAIKVDKFEKVSEQSKHSSSVVDLFAAFSNLLEITRKLHWGELEPEGERAKVRSELLKVTASVVCNTSSWYCSTIAETTKQSLSNYALAETLTTAQLAPLTRVFMEQEIARLLARELGSEKDSKKVIKRVRGLKGNIKHKFGRLMRLHKKRQSATASPEAQEPLFDYLNLYLTEFHDGLPRQSFKRVLKRLWAFVSGSLEKALVSSCGHSSEEQSRREAAAGLLELLGEFFTAGGEGLSSDMTSPTIEKLHALTALGGLTTRELNDLAQRGEPTSQLAAQSLLRARLDKRTSNMV